MVGTMRFRSAILWALLLSLIAVPAHADKRIALVIGNKDYKAAVGPLANPLNDIRLVGDALKSVGFEVLKPVENATRNDMLSAIYGFAAALKAAGPDAVGFLYYSGHGLASEGENYLVPIDVTEPSTLQLSIQGVKQSEVLAILRRQAPNAAHYLVLDACRNNLQGSRGGKGFVPVEQESGVLVAFSTAPGKTASDTGTGSGPYAAALAMELVKPQSDLLMFHGIRMDVIDKTNHDQVPWFEDGIQRRERPVFAIGATVPEPLPPRVLKGRLFILAIGVDTYTKFKLENSLHFAGADAYLMAKTLAEKAGPLFREVKVISLVSGDPTAPTKANIENALALFKDADARDMVILFVAGHGVNEGPNYLFLPEDAERQNGHWVPSSTVNWETIQRALRSTPALSIMFADTTHAGGAFNARGLKDAADDALAAMFATDASTLARESETLRHGVFAYALAKGLYGAADRTNRGLITVRDLAVYVSDEVNRITNGDQEPAFTLGVDFPLAVR